MESLIIFLVYMLLISLAINLIMFIPAYYFQTDKLTDISYAISFLTITWVSYFSIKFNYYKLIISVLVTIWAIRLAIFLLVRIWNQKQDKRFNKFRGKFLMFMGFWIIQGFSAWIILFPVILSNYFLAYQNKIENIVFVTLGILLWSGGFLIETIADSQKFRFRQNIKNKDKWINEGLWKYSRHPNYFGEIIIWISMFIISVNFIEIKYLFLSVISPIYLFILLRFISGIPILEKKADEKWGNDKEYQNYKTNTRLFIPLKKFY